MMNGPHQGQPLLTAGRPLDEAGVAMLLVHGRGGNARDILSLADTFNQSAFAYVAPQAAGNTWYPYSFMESMDRNQPGLDSALAAVQNALATLAEAGIPAEHTIIGGFSQGACLAAEFVARNARRYGGLIAFSGGLIGPEGIPRNYDGSLSGTPVFIGCSDIDPHIPVGRVEETAEVLGRLGGDVTKRIYPGMGHTINQDEVDHAVRIMQRLAAESF